MKKKVTVGFLALLFAASVLNAMRPDAVRGDDIVPRSYLPHIAGGQPPEPTPVPPAFSCFLKLASRLENMRRWYKIECRWWPGGEVVNMELEENSGSESAGRFTELAPPGEISETGNQAWWKDLSLPVPMPPTETIAKFQVEFNNCQNGSNVTVTASPAGQSEPVWTVASGTVHAECPPP